MVNFLGLLKMAHRPWWWILLMLIPTISLLVWIVVMFDLAKAFGHGVAMALVLVFFTPLGYVILGFGESQYQLAEDPLFG